MSTKRSKAPSPASSRASSKAASRAASRATSRIGFKAAPVPIAVSPERAARLYRLLQFLHTGPKSRAAILQRLRIDIRTFYRDLELLRECGLEVLLGNRRYSLEADIAEAVARLPFPDPGLTLGEAMILARGRSQVHKKLRNLLQQIMR